MGLRRAPRKITAADLPPENALDSEFQAADTAHVNASDPHTQYLLQAEGDARYRQSASSQSFTRAIQAVGLSSGTMAVAPAQSGNSGLEAQATNTTSAAFISLHRPGVFGTHFGLSENNVLQVGGWSMGLNVYKIWHEAYGTPVWQTPSDKNLKENIRPIPSALALILECKPVSFRYNKTIRDKDIFGDSFQREKTHYGFLANEFALQDLVSEKNEGYLGLDYIEIIPFLCRALQELEAQVQELRSQIAAIPKK